MLLDPLAYLKTALLFAFVDSECTEDVNQCPTVESLADFCKDYHLVGSLCFSVDQLNALDPEPLGEDEITNDSKSPLRKLLLRMSARHIDIQGASADNKTAKYVHGSEGYWQPKDFLGGRHDNSKSAVL